MIEYHTTNRDRVCKICGEAINRFTYALVMRRVHVSPKIVDLHFHEGCFERSLQWAKENHNIK